MAQANWFTGVWPALVTPLTDDDRLKVDVTRRLVTYLIEAGIGGLFVCGGTGEGVLLPLPVRKQMAELVIEQAGGRVPVMVHVGATATADAVALARHAAEAGADAVAAVPPFYHSVSFQAIKEHYAMIAGASELPLYLYYIPSATGVTLTAQEMWELCQMPNVRGFKYSSHDICLLERILSLSGGTLNVLSGPDELFLPFQVTGTDGAIGTTYNVLAHHFVRLRQKLLEGDVVSARRLQAQANRVIDVLLVYGAIPATKEILRLMGLDCGPCRRPLRQLSEAEAAALRRDLDRTDFWDIAELPR